MKRASIHFLFWSAFMLEDALLQFLWVGPLLPKITENDQLWMALQAAFLALLPKIIFSYYVIYIAINSLMNQKGKAFISYLKIFLLFVGCIVLYRIFFYYLIYPVSYRGAIKARSLFDTRSILMAVMDIGFVSGAAIAVKLIRIQLAGKEREKVLIKEKLETELKFLRNQTNPHFLFNTLNNIYGLARKKSDDTAEIVLKLSKLLRFMIYESNNQFISLAEELKMLEDYLELERIRYNNRLTITFQKEIDDPTRFITPLLLLPLIENAFKHGVSETIANSYIHIKMELVNNHLTFTIENTKEEQELPTDKVTANIGLVNLKRQLELIYKEYDLQVINNPDNFKVRLFINLGSYANV